MNNEQLLRQRSEFFQFTNTKGREILSKTTTNLGKSSHTKSAETTQITVNSIHAN